MRRLRLLPLVAAALALVACGGDDKPALTIGVVLPETGALGSSSGPMISAVRLAEEDIRAGAAHDRGRPPHPAEAFRRDGRACPRCAEAVWYHSHDTRS